MVSHDSSALHLPLLLEQYTIALIIITTITINGVSTTTIS